MVLHAVDQAPARCFLNITPTRLSSKSTARYSIFPQGLLIYSPQGSELPPQGSLFLVLQDSTPARFTPYKAPLHKA